MTQKVWRSGIAKTIILDVEANQLELNDKLKVHVVCCKDITNDIQYRFVSDWSELQELLDSATRIVGHNIVHYDAPVLKDVLGIRIDPARVVDTLVVSRLVWFDCPGGHSLAQLGINLGIQKKFADKTAEFFQEYSQELEDRCWSDIQITEAVYKDLLKYINSPKWQKAIAIEHKVSSYCLDLHNNGFAFDLDKALNLKDELSLSLSTLDKEIKDSFLPKVKFIREVIPKETQHGTIARNSIPRALGPDLTPYTPGAAFSYIEYQNFNPGSTRQIVERLNEAGWRPVEKTKGHIEALRDRSCHAERRQQFATYGWKVSEENLKTLPPDAPPAAHKLAQRLLIASRVSDLEEWINLAQPHFCSNERYWRIHGRFNGIGAWTQRLSHSNPNTANIPTRKPQDSPWIAALNDTVRTLWVASPGRLLVGVDADQIQLRILAHYMRDQTFIDALVQGDKSKGTDVHSLNVKAIGPACQGRRDAKTFIYSWLLGAGIERVAEILGCSFGQAKEARSRFIEYYPGLKRVRNVDIVRDARNGYFRGLDGRYVRIYGDDAHSRRHFTLGGYLQNGEKIIMAYALDHWTERLRKEGIPFWLVNWVHDEWQIEIPEDMELAQYTGSIVADSIEFAGRELGTHCPMKGSVLNPHDKLAVGKNWLETH